MDSMSKMHGGGSNVDDLLEEMARHSWNVFRYVADYLHSVGVIAVCFTLLKNRSCRGLSFRTQLLYLIVFLSRYLDLLTHHQKFYLVFFKLFFICTSLIICITMYRWRRTLEKHKDTCSIALILVTCFVVSFFTSDTFGFSEFMWTFSEWLEAFAMVPQYIFSYRDVKRAQKPAVAGKVSVCRISGDPGVSAFVLTVGSYRLFYAMNWIYKKYNITGYSDRNSWIGGAIEIAFFLDYVNFRFLKRKSILRSLTLSVDDKLNEVQEKVEMKVLSGLGKQRQGDFDYERDAITSVFAAATGAHASTSSPQSPSSLRQRKLQYDKEEDAGLVIEGSNAANTGGCVSVVDAVKCEGVDDDVALV